MKVALIILFCATAIRAAQIPSTTERWVDADDKANYNGLDWSGRDWASSNNLTPILGASVSNGFLYAGNTISNGWRVTNAVLTNYPFTISAWVRLTDTSANHEIAGLYTATINNTYIEISFSTGLGWEFAVRNNPGGGAIIGGNFFPGLQIPMTTNLNWHYLAGVALNSTNFQLYIDGVNRGTNFGTGVFPAVTTTTLGMRDRTGGSTNPLNGFEDEVAFTARALTAPEILINYQKGLPRHLPSP